MISSGGELLTRLRDAFPNSTLRATFPFLRLRIVSERFVNLDDEAREELIAEAAAMDVAGLRGVMDRLFLRFDLVAHEAEEPASPTRGETWLGTFADVHNNVDPPLENPRVVHFYGFKGGQGRSTMAAFLANDLALDGRRVLVVDLDAEAPSLDLVFGLGDVPPEASLVGLRAGLAVTPLAIAAPRGGGSVSVLAFRPSAETFDLDATALAFEASVNAPSHERLAATLRDGVAKRYDILLLDHRTGLGATVPSWVRTLPGPVVVFDRLDGQSLRAVRNVARLWGGLASPGAIVSYVPSNLSSEAMWADRRREVWPWLEALANAKSERAEERLAPEDIEDHWIPWPDDNAFRRPKLPERDEVGGRTRESISQLRQILDLAGRDWRAEVPVKLHPSGAEDQGLFIMNPALRELSQSGSPIRFIFGRKGTGKTRLLHELARRHVGKPLVVAEDEHIGGLSAHNATLSDVSTRARDEKNFEGLWWTLIVTALDCVDANRENLELSLRAFSDPKRPLLRGTDAQDRVRSGAEGVFLVDGLETMLPNREDSRANIQALVNVSSVLETNAVFRGRLSLRIFLRSDIARWGFENFEQQSHGKHIDLSWSTQAILNFVLSRLPHLPWMRKTFPDVVEDVQKIEADIQLGAISETRCLEHLLRVFPTKIGRLNLNTTTFLKTYFSDDPTGQQSYYPRVYDKFLTHIDSAGKPLVAGRVSQEVIVAAHDEASTDFLTQVRQELRFLVPLDDRNLERFLSALKEKRTPFVRRELGATIRNSLKLPMRDIDATLEAMKEIGVFEEHPRGPESWRAGRVFKAALRMKYGKA